MQYENLTIEDFIVCRIFNSCIKMSYPYMELIGFIFIFGFVLIAEIIVIAINPNGYEKIVLEIDRGTYSEIQIWPHVISFVPACGLIGAFIDALILTSVAKRSKFVCKKIFNTNHVQYYYVITAIKEIAILFVVCTLVNEATIIIIALASMLPTTTIIVIPAYTFKLLAIITKTFIKGIISFARCYSNLYGFIKQQFYLISLSFVGGAQFVIGTRGRDEFASNESDGSYFSLGILFATFFSTIFVIGIFWHAIQENEKLREYAKTNKIAKVLLNIDFITLISLAKEIVIAILLAHVKSVDVIVITAIILTFFYFEVVAFVLIALIFFKIFKCIYIECVMVPYYIARNHCCGGFRDPENAPLISENTVC